MTNEPAGLEFVSSHLNGHLSSIIHMITFNQQRNIKQLARLCYTSAGN